MYSDTVPNIKTLGQDLLIVADRFNLARLKMMCEDNMAEKISLANVANFLTCSDMANAAKLKAACLDFVANNPCDVIGNDSWSKHLNKRPLLYKDAFEVLAKKPKKF